MSASFNYNRREREIFISGELDRLYEIGRFSVDKVQLKSSGFKETLDLFEDRIQSWRSSDWVSKEEKKRAARHKVGANTAFAIMHCLPLTVVANNHEGNLYTNPYESIANEYFAYKLAVARIFDEHADKIALFKFPTREIKMILSLFINKEWTPKSLALELYRTERNYLLEYANFVSPDGKLIDLPKQAS